MIIIQKINDEKYIIVELKHYLCEVKASSNKMT